MRVRWAELSLATMALFRLLYVSVAFSGELVRAREIGYLLKNLIPLGDVYLERRGGGGLAARLQQRAPFPPTSPAAHPAPNSDVARLIVQGSDVRRANRRGAWELITPLC